MSTGSADGDILSAGPQETGNGYRISLPEVCRRNVATAGQSEIGNMTSAGHQDHSIRSAGQLPLKNVTFQLSGAINNCSVSWFEDDKAV